MIRIFRKSWRRSRRTVCAALCFVFLSSLLAVPAGAAYSSITGTFTYVVTLDGSRYNLYGSLPHTGGTGSYPVSSGVLPAGDHRLQLSWCHVDNVGKVEGAIGCYYSFYFQFPEASSLVTEVDLSGCVPIIEYDTITESARFSPETFGSCSSFGTPVLDGYRASKGWVVKGRTSYIESINPISYLYFNVLRNGNYSAPVYSYSTPSSAYPLLYSPSATVIISDVVTLEWMEGLADSLTGDSDTLTALYADVMNILNDMYAVMGDQLAVERAIKGYFETLLPLVESINTNTANIYSLLQTQFQLLRTLIATESDDIQSAIEQQTDDLIAYFDTVFSGAVGDMPEKSDDLETSVGDFSDAESDYQSNATQRFEELASTFSGFTGGTLAGVTLASTLFTRVWNALGQYNIVYYFPLLLGLSLVIIGRLPRGSGGQSSSEKHRGDSSA